MTRTRQIELWENSMNTTKRLDGKLGFVLCTVAVAAWTGCTTYQEQPRGGGAYEGSYAEIRTESDFYEPLSPYGRWEVVGSYGRCWIPGGVDAGWSPYSNGYWQESDAGWYWASDEPWGWATYHYGRWDSSPQYGWYWVPQTQWAPAWVSWREGGGYVGWAPMGPSGRGVVAISQRGAASGGYVFVEERRFLDPVRPAGFIANKSVFDRTAINQGPGAAVIERSSGRKVQAIPARDLRGKEEAKVAAKHPALTSAREKSVQPPLPRQTGTALPAREPRQPERPAVTPPPLATKNEIHPPDAQSRIVKPTEAARAQQGPASERAGEQRKPVPAAVEARRETQQEAKHEIKPEATPAAKPGVGSEVKPAAKPVSKPEGQQQAKHEPQPEAKAEPKSVPAQPAAVKEQSEQKPGRDAEKKDQ
jgi:hypothetical protein